MIDRSKETELGIHIDRLAYLDGFLTKAAQDKLNSSIAICVARRGVEIFSGAYGPAAPGGPPLRLDMITDVQSVTKPFTATMVMMLQEDGLLEIVDPVVKYYPQFTGTDKEGVCLRHLLTHTSGMDDEFSYTYLNHFLQNILCCASLPDNANEREWESAFLELRRTLGFPEDEIVRDGTLGLFDRLMLSVPLKNKPGEQFSYCNTGYRILAGVVEKVSGETMDKLAQRRIFEPLGMTDSHFVLPEEKWPRVLLREESCRGGEWMNSIDNRSSFAGSSGLKTTMPDLLKFGLMFYRMGALDGVRILSPASVRAMTMDYNRAVPPSLWRGMWYGSSWALGWNIRGGKFDDLGVLRADSAYDHAGYGGARLLVDPENELVVALYMVDENEDDYILHAKTMNILYSALD